MRFRRGDLVWARVLFPQKWWPGLVLQNDILGVTVSFFDVNKPRHFLESELRSFGDGFEALVHNINCSTSQAILDRALKLLGRRVVRSLTCPCQSPSLESRSETKQTHRGKVVDLFRANEVLDFVRRLAVAPWVRDSDFVCAVTVAAQLHIFRRFVLTHKNSSHLGNHSQLHSSLPLCKTVELVAQSSDSSDLGIGNLLECLPKSKSRTNNEQTKVQSPHGMLVTLDCLVLDTYYMSRVSLNSVKHPFLEFRNLSCQSTADFQPPESPRSSEVLLSDPFCMKSQPSVKVDGKCGTVESHINTMGLKRRHDQTADSGYLSQLPKTMQLISNNRADTYPWETKTGCKVLVSDALISGPALSDLSLKMCKVVSFSSFEGADTHLESRTRCAENMPDYFQPGSLSEAEIQKCNSLRDQRLTFKCNSVPMCLIPNMFNARAVEHTSHGNYAPQLSMSQDIKENTRMLSDNRTCLPLAKMQDLRASTNFAKGNDFCTSVEYDAVEKITHGREEMRNNCKSTYAMKTYSDSCKISAGNCQLSLLTTDQISIKLGDINDATSVETSTRMTMNASFEDSSVDNKKPHQPGTIDQSVKPQLAHQPVVRTFANSNSLHMKFPKGFNLPSKPDLIKKFSRFGRVDSLRTKVFSNIGSAQVFFLHQLDAVVAYQYARRKKSLFGEAKILFWLAPFVHKRRGTTLLPSSPSLNVKPIEFNLRSCLKRSNSHGKDPKKCIRKVRFLMET